MGGGANPSDNLGHVDLRPEARGQLSSVVADVRPLPGLGHVQLIAMAPAVVSEAAARRYAAGAAPVSEQPA